MRWLTGFALDRPRLSVVLLAAVTLALGSGLPRVETEFGYRVLVGDEHPSIRALDGFIDRFGGGLPTLIAWRCGSDHPCNSVFDDVSLAMAHAITTDLQQTESVVGVIGPANAPLMVPGEAGFAVRHFVEHGEVIDDAAMLAASALRDPSWAGRLVSSDQRMGAIVVQIVDSRGETFERVVEAIEATIEPFQAQGFEFHLAGDAVSSVVAGRDLAESTGRLIPFTVLAIGLVLIVLTRSLAQTVVSLATMGVALLWTIGLQGWLGWPQDGIHEALAPLILVIGVCDAIHFLSSYGRRCEQGGAPQGPADRRALLLRACGEVAPACVVTTLTTAGAFLSFATSALDTFVRFGTVAAFGVTACLFLTFSLLPLVMQWLPSPARALDRNAP